MKIFQGLRNRTKKNLVLIFALVLAPLLLSISPVFSNNTIARKQVTITSNQVINDDLYLAGETFTIDGRVKGDAVLAGKQITINGIIDGDLIVAGQTVLINGTVNDDVRIAGQVLMLDSKAKIGDDLIAAGASLEKKAGSSVGGDINIIKYS
jgi:cytoskeletal protein CcmA (bactofilin family)